MLAKLLRTLITVQVLMGAIVGWAIAYWRGWPFWTAGLFALLMPFSIMVLVDIYSGWVSRGKEPVTLWLK